MERQAQSRGKGIDGDGRGHDAHRLNVSRVTQAAGTHLVVPLFGQTAGINADTVDNLDDRMGQSPEMCMRARNRGRGEADLTLLTEGTRRRLACLGRNGDPLRATPPGTGPSQTLPGALMGGTNVVPYHHG